jgi:uncharacterized protein (TIGR00255 family)
VIDMALARCYHAAFTDMKQQLGIDGPVSLELIASQKELILREEQVEMDDSLMQQELLPLVKLAVEQMDAMRQREGAALQADLQQRQEELRTLIDKIAQRAPQVVADYAERLRQRISQLATDCTVEDGRLLQEIAIMADRCDVTEELVRLKSHLEQFAETMQLHEPVGRKLDFLLQEINREVNTIGSKANDVQIATMVVALKAELEKIREQVQNIE